MGVWKRLRDVTSKGLIAIALLHTTTQISYWGNEVYHKARPSETRSEFQRETGFPINGWADDVEDKKREIGLIAQVIAQEKAEGAFQLTSARIEPANYFKNNVIDQIDRLITTGHSGYYFPGIKTIVAEPSASPTTWHHEIKHAKTFDLLEKHPEFRKQWEAFSKDRNGNSLYLGTGEQACVRIRGLSWLRSEKDDNPHLDEQLGFVSSYARTNFYEDVAEVGAMAESDRFQEVFEWINGPERNERIEGKITLAEKYGLIPKGFTEYLAVDKLYRAMWGQRGSIDLSKVPPFLKASEEYLTKRPQSIYACNLRYERGTAMKRGANDIDKMFTLDQVKAEFSAAIHTPFKSSIPYSIALDKLALVNKVQKRLDVADIFERASILYSQRQADGDLHLATTGVNDYLVQQHVF
jgi:hypothetical protein